MNLLEQKLQDLQKQEASIKKLLTCAIHYKNYEKANYYKKQLDETRNEINKILKEIL